MRNYKQYVIAKLPRAGLANKLLVWSRALSFASLNNFSLITINWNTLHLGPFLRNEKTKRIYQNYFKTDSLLNKLQAIIHLVLRKNIVNDPAIEINQSNTTLFKFQKVFFWMHFFDSIRSHRTLIKERFFTNLLSERFKKILIALPITTIGIHIRRGDFSKYTPGQKFDKEVVLVQTPLDYFMQMVIRLRELAGSNLKVVVFSDGHKSELKQVLDLPNIELFQGTSDLEDLLALSKCKVIVPSPSSTFGLFAGFISDSILLHHPDFYMRDIRPQEVNEIYYEGPFNLKNNANHPEELLIQLRKLS